MIEATCTACGNINRVAEGDLPSGTKFVTCASCKARVAIPLNKAKGVELADLPSPKRSSPLGGEASKPAPRSGLAAALDAELPAPRSPNRPGTPPPALELDDLLAPPGAGLGISDLPAPKGALPTRHAPSEKAGLADLPAPKPRAKAKPPELPAIKPPPALTDLPAPKPRVPAMTPIDLGPPIDLPSPRAHVPGVIDLPAPRMNPLDDLPMPKHASERDLPMPKPGGGAGQELTPARPNAGAGQELTPARSNAQRGGLDQELTPVSNAAGSVDLPAPKGFFEDLPQPATAPKAETGLPAPKGFFEDLPGRVNQSAPARPELPAPKGFFEDLPGRVNPNKPEAPAPKGFFDDLPGRVNQSKPEPPAPKGFFDDLPQPSRAKPVTSSPVELDLDEPAAASSIDSGPELDLGTAGSASSFDDLDLSAPSAVPARSLEAAKRAQHAPAPRDSGRDLPGATFKAAADTGATLELAEPRQAAATPKLEPKRPKPVSIDPLVARAKARRRRIALAAGLVMVALGAGGFYLYRRHAASVARAEQIEAELGNARNALNAKDAEHWQRAALAANKVVELDPKHPEALGIAAEALFAQGLSDGKNAKTKFAQARQLMSRAAEAGVTGSPIIRASVLQSIAGNQPDVALAKIKPLVAAAPKDPTLALYLGWANAEKGDSPAAIAAFDIAITGEAVKLPALYGRARAKLDQGNTAGATTDFEAILALDNAHLGAQVGLAAALPAAKAQQQEADLMALLERKDIATGDQRAVLDAYLLLATAARRGNRLEIARERYRNALAIAPNDVAAMTGLAETELRDGKLDSAAELLKKALDISKDDVRAQLAQSELSLLRKDLPDAMARLGVLAARNPPLPERDQMRVKLLQGRLFDAQSQDEQAVAAYLEAAKLGGDQDLTPTLAATTKLTTLADKATKAKDTAKATAYRAQADELLAKVAANAQKDPQIALVLGTAYIQANEAAKAEPWLRRAVDARADADSLYQLAKALARLGKPDEAIVGLKKAIELAPARPEIALELARTYEVANNDTEAEALYVKLIAAAAPSLEVRARAGRFFARRGDPKRAAEQATKILAADSQHAAGLFLKAEGLLADGKYDEARKLLAQAVTIDRDPQYLDAQGRVAELIAAQSGDTKVQDAALIAYMAASELAPTMFNPLAGQGRLYINRREAAKAVAPLLAASKLRPADGDVAYLIGLAYKELQQTTAAIEWLKRATALKPNADASWNLGQLYLEANKGALAAGALATATRVALESEKQTGKAVPWLTEALHRLGRAYLDTNNNAGARDAFNLYIGRSPPPGPQRAEAERALLRLNP